jgi:hypothetical protein
MLRQHRLAHRNGIDRGSAGRWPGGLPGNRPGGRIWTGSGPPSASVVARNLRARLGHPPPQRHTTLPV